MARVTRSRVTVEGTTRDKLAVVDGVDEPPYAPRASLAEVGRPQPRAEALEKAGGRAAYASDVRLPGQLEALFLRSPHARARVAAFDWGGADRSAAVFAALGPREAAAIRIDEEPLFPNPVRYAGEPVAAVAAENLLAAGEALARVTVRYEPMTHAATLEEALEPRAPRLRRDGNAFRRERTGRDTVRGDVERGLAEAEAVVHLTFRTPAYLHNAIEPHGAVAVWDGDRVTVFVSTQNLFGVRDALARSLGLPLNRVHAAATHTGGAFGAKGELDRATLAAALLARMAGRPVRLFHDREEENVAAGNRAPTVQEVVLGARRDGALTAIDLRSYAAIGAAEGWVAPVGGIFRELYACPNVRTREFGVVTSTGPHRAFRAPGYLEGAFALESAMDEMAERLGLDPVALRVRNAPRSLDPATGEPLSRPLLAHCLERGARLFSWTRERSPAGGRVRRGAGVAAQVWSAAGGPPAFAHVVVQKDGSAEVIAGTQDIGTGTRTILAQVAAEELALPSRDVVVRLGRTEGTPFAPPSWGSMTAPSMAPAVRNAAADARRQILEIAAAALGEPEGSLVLEGRAVRSRDGRRHELEALLAGLGDFTVVGRGSRHPNREDRVPNTFGAQFAQVAVDTATGEVRVERVAAVHDCGRVLNPLLARSQVEGGIVMGIGSALTERRVVDARSGRVMNPSLLDYKIPTIADAPERIDVEFAERPDDSPSGVGAYGLGEPPVIPVAAAIANAVRSAIGRRLTELPLLPSRILAALASGPEEPEENRGGR